MDDPPLPYTIQVFRKRGSREKEITPAVLDEGAAMLVATDEYRVELEIPGQTISRAKIEWIHIRDTFKQANRSKVFPTITEAEPTATINTKDRKVVVVDYPTPVSRATITFTAGTAAQLGVSGLEAHHSYLWPRIRVTGRELESEGCPTGCKPP